MVYNDYRKKKREVKTMYYVEWYDIELGEIFYTVTDEKGIRFMKSHPEVYDIFVLKNYEIN